jgi:hypothetical protein
VSLLVTSTTGAAQPAITRDPVTDALKASQLLLLCG